MFGLSMLNPWKWGTLGLALALIVSVGWGARVDHLRSSWEAKYQTLDGQAQSVVIATQQAANNPTLKWAGVPAQITALASSNLALKSAIETANSKITDMGAETQRLIAAGNTLRSQLSVAQAARQSAVDQLKVMSLTPGDRQNCPALLSQTQDALDLSYGSGL